MKEDGVRKEVIALLVLLCACAAPVRLTPAPSPTPTLKPSPTPLLLSSPTPTPSPTPIIYVVQPGDTLAGIAALYGTTAEAICALNELEDCELIFPGDELLIPGEGVTPTIPTPSPTPTHTPTLTDTPTPTPTPTPLLTPTPTDTPVVPTPTPTPTFTPTPTPTPSYEFMYEEGSMQQASNCTTIYIEGFVIGQGGAPASNIVVRLRWFDNDDYDVTGGDGKWGFAPYGNYWDNPQAFHSRTDFYVDIVDQVGRAVVRSDTLQVVVEDCDIAGQSTNIKFVYQW